MISSLLETSFSLLKEGYTINLNWLGQLVGQIIGLVGSVGVGVIVFTLILKAITTPFDIYQRISMRKQSLIMREMQPELDKLQKQYANDKQTYQAKMMELQKKNGYSMLGACLPMLITLVVIIFAIGAFQTYASYANLMMYEQMARAYNGAVKEYVLDAEHDYHLAREGEEDDGYVITLEEFGEDVPHEKTDAKGTAVYTVRKDVNGVPYMYVESDRAGIYVYYKYSLDTSALERKYFIDTEKLYREKTAEIDALVNEETDVETACANYLQGLGSAAAAESFGEADPSFLWVKNVWYPDVSYKHPIEPNYEEFTKAFRGDVFMNGEKVEGGISAVIPLEDYEALTAALETEKTTANGYYILIILTIGLMVLSQFITMRSSKEANKYQTLDGQGASTQKMMMVMMPLIYAITGFFWTAAFSIYIAMSSIIGIVITLLSNLIIGRIFRKKEEEEIRKRYTRTVPWKKDDRRK